MNVHLTWTRLLFVISFLKTLHGNNNRFDYGLSCSEQSTCEPKAKLICFTKSVPSKCVCKPGLVAIQKNKRMVTNCASYPEPPEPPIPPIPLIPTTPPPISTHNGSCSLTKKCARGLICTQGKCNCSEGFSWSSSSKFCKPVPVVAVACDPGSIPNACDKQGIANYECSETDKKCHCPEKTEYAPEFKACKLKAGEDCSFVLDNNQQVTMHDLCASQHCSKDEVSAKCDCREEVNGGRMIWSQQHNRCIRNFFGNDCKENSNCTESNLNSQGRVGLICNATVKPARCDCPEDRSFSQGYCVTASALYNESCDPTGLSTTCKTEGGTLLTCRQENEDVSKWKCACLIKDVSARAGRKGASAILYWDSKNQICDLAPNDERCTANYQCKTGRCSKNRCRSKSDGSRVSLQNFLVITITLCVLF